MVVEPLVIYGSMWLVPNIYLGIRDAIKPENSTSRMYSQTYEEASLPKKIIMSIIIPGETIVYLVRKYHKK